MLQNLYKTDSFFEIDIGRPADMPVVILQNLVFSSHLLATIYDASNNINTSSVELQDYSMYAISGQAKFLEMKRHTSTSRVSVWVNC